MYLNSYSCPLVNPVVVNVQMRFKEFSPIREVKSIPLSPLSQYKAYEVIGDPPLLATLTAGISTVIDDSEYSSIIGAAVGLLGIVEIFTTAADSTLMSPSPRILIALYLTMTFESFTRLNGNDQRTLIGITHCQLVTIEL